MKKLVATLSIAALATGAWAQGFVTIANSTVIVATNSTASGGASGATSRTASAYYFDTLINASTVTTINTSLQGLFAAGWSDTGITGVNNSGLGGNGHITQQNISSSVWQANNFQSAIVIGWSANLGTSVSNVLSAAAGAALNGGTWSGGSLTAGEFLGYSTIATAAAGSASGSAAALFASLTSGQVPTPISTGFNLYGVGSVPEPGTLALAGLGVASLLIFRRRK